MRSPLSNILVKIFARGFYKVNSGLLIFLFVVLISYCFFINTLGDVTLLPPGKEIFYQFIILLTFVSNPGMMILFFIAWVVYTLKSWQYVSEQLRMAHHEFLFYSISSSGRLKQFGGWFYAQFIISLPFVLFAALASVIGLILHHYAMVAVVISFTAALIGASAFIYQQQINGLVRQKQPAWLLRVGQKWSKPFFCLFIFQIFDKLKLAFVLSKLLSYLVIISVMFSFADVKKDTRVAAFTVLGIVMTHAILIYQQHRFNLLYLTVTRNFPYSLTNLYLQNVANYMLLLLPECVWLVARFDIFNAFGLILLLLSVIMLFHCILYRIGLAMNRYLPWLLGMFFGISLLILFGLTWLLLPCCLAASFVLFYFNYYTAELNIE